MQRLDAGIVSHQREAAMDHTRFLRYALATPMPWQHLKSTNLAGAALDLYGDEAGHFMIRANGLELMSSRAHASEDDFGAMAAEAATGDHPRILIGGLGLGFTLEAVAALKPRAAITVAEISPEVIAWYRHIVAPACRLTLPASAEIVAADVRDLLAEPAAFDVIALDVDNGPEAFTVPGNDALYSAEGLARLRSALAPGGAALLWSGFRSPAFAARAAAAGFAVICRAAALPQHPHAQHFVYVLKA